MIPGFVPSPVPREGFGAPSSLYQLLSGDGSLCMAFFFMLSRYSCCDTARTEAKISSSSQSVRPFTRAHTKKNTLAKNRRNDRGSKKVDTSCGFHSHPTHQPLFPLLASFLCSLLQRSRAEGSDTTRAYEVNLLSLIIFPFHTTWLFFPPTYAHLNGKKSDQTFKTMILFFQRNGFEFLGWAKCENCHCAAVWLI